MPNYRRLYVPGGTYFFTVVTLGRRPLFVEDTNRARLRAAISSIKSRHPFTAFATVLLPDHLHTVWTLPEGDCRYSMRWRRIKEEFTESFLAAGNAELSRSSSRIRHGERGIWQRRFWEHTVRDSDDLQRCVDYIHWNPVKHGYVRRPGEWKWSTFAKFVASGDYPDNWGEVDPFPGYDEPEWE
jgi:putative transposase